MDDARTSWILYAALASTQLVLIGVFVGAMERQAAADPALVIALPLVALGTATASVTVGRLWMTEAPARTRHILRWALGESVTLFGCVSWMLGSPSPVAIGLMAFGTLLVVGQPPLDGGTRDR